MLVLCGAGVGGGSHVYGNTMYVPSRKFFDPPEWAGITDWADDLAPHIDRARRMLGVVRYPYLPTDVDRYMQQVATEMGRGETFNKTPVGVYFGRPGVEADDPYFGAARPRRTGCISCGNCNNGCGHNAKNKLTTNYLYLAEKLGGQVHDLNEVYDLAPLDGGGFEVRTRHPGWAKRAAHRRHTATPLNRSSSPRTPTARRSSCTTCGTARVSSSSAAVAASSPANRSGRTHRSSAIGSSATAPICRTNAT